jgi:hypothetical protein
MSGFSALNQPSKFPDISSKKMLETQGKNLQMLRTKPPDETLRQLAKAAPFLPQTPNWGKGVMQWGLND